MKTDNSDKNIHLSPAPPSLHCTNCVQKIPPVIFCNTVFGLSTVFGQVHTGWIQNTESLLSTVIQLQIILAPKLTSRACALRVCSPPAAIAVTQAISQTLICKALQIDSPSHAQMNKQRHKTWSFCLKYYILSKSNKIQRQVGGIFHLWQFSLDQIAHGRWPGIKKWRHVNKWKPWSFQLHCAVKPNFSVTKWKMHLSNTW